MLGFLFAAVGVSGLSSIEGMSDAPTPVQREWSKKAEILEAELADEYYTSSYWRKNFECTSCQTVMSDLGDVVENLATWKKTPTEGQYLERLNAKCEKMERKFGIAVMESYSKDKPWHEQELITVNSNIRLVDRKREPSLNLPLLRETLGTTCNDVLDLHLPLLMNQTFPTTRYMTYAICVKGLKRCEEQRLVTQLYESPSREDIERFREKGKKALEQFWKVLSNETHPERRRIRCMACDVTLARIQDEIGWRNPNVQKRQIHPTIAQLEKTCGNKATWAQWGLWYDFWSETVVAPFFLKDKNLAKSAVKLQAPVVGDLLFEICRQVATTSRADLDGYEEPIPNCHNMPWCQFTEWESDSRSENTYHTIPIERDPKTNEIIRFGKEFTEAEETEEEIEEEEKRDAEIARRKKEEKIRKAKAKQEAKKKNDL